MAYLEIKDIYKSYYLGKEEFPVLKGINLSFELGQFVSILGESGGGKSTLMNIIGGLDRSFEGQVLVDGHLLNHKQEKKLDQYRRETIGYIYQAYNLISHLSVLDNVKTSLDMTTLTAKEKEERALALLDRVGLREHARKYPNQLSGGQKQRVAIARALSSDPKVIIADEPTGALDSENTKEVLKILGEIAAEGRLVIAVTHSQEVANSSHRIVRMADGHITDDQVIAESPGSKQQGTYLTSRRLPFWTGVSTAFKHFAYHKGRNSLIIAGTAIGLLAVLLFNGLGVGVGKYVDDQITSQVNPEIITVTPFIEEQSAEAGASELEQEQAERAMLAAGFSGMSALTFSESQIDQLEKVAHVTNVEPIYTAQNVTVSLGDQSSRLNSLINWTQASADSSVETGAAPKKGEIVLAEDIASKLVKDSQAADLIGQTVELSYDTIDKDGKATTVSLTAKVSGLSANSGYQSNAIATETLVEAMEKAKLDLSVASLAVKVDGMDKVETTEKAIKAIKEDGKQVFVVTSVLSLIKTLQTYISLITNILDGIAGMSLLVSALMIIVTMYMSVADRTKEIGILRAQGQSKADIRNLFISESLIIGLISALVATGVSYGLATGLNAALSNIAAFDFIQIELGQVGLVFVIALAISLLASYLPARRAASLNTIDALSAD